MKYLRLACICVLCASPNVLHADVVNGIQMISQSYSISAQWDDYWYTWGGPGPLPQQVPYPPGTWSVGYQVLPNGHVTGGYALSTSDGSPVAAHIGPVPSPNGGGNYLTASTSIDRFSFANSFTSADWAATRESTPLGTASWNGTIQTSAQGIWDFRPTGSYLNVNMNYSFYDFYNGSGGEYFAGLTITLSDKTSATTLLNIAPSGAWGAPAPPPEVDTFAVNPNDVYEFSISGWSDTYDLDYGSEFVTASMTSVPEPGACFLLSLGLAGLLGFKSRFRS